MEERGLGSWRDLRGRDLGQGVYCWLEMSGRGGFIFFLCIVNITLKFDFLVFFFEIEISVYNNNESDFLNNINLK